MTIEVKDAGGVTRTLQTPNANGRAAAADSRPVALSNEDVALLGPANETAPADDTASVGLNGRMQRIAQRLTSLIAALGSPFQVGGALGAGTAEIGRVGKVQQTVTDIIIANGQSLSAAVDLSVYRLCGIAMSAGFTGTVLTFQASYDGANWNDVYDSNGLERTIVVAAGRRVVLNPSDFFGIRHIKVRSGTAASATNEAAARTLKLIAEA